MLTGYDHGKKLLTLWDVASGKEVRSFAGHTDWVVGVAFLAGGKRVASASRDGRLLLHDVVSGKALKERRPYAAECMPVLAASQDGQLALTCGDDRVAGPEPRSETAGRDAPGVGVLKLWDADLNLLRAFGGRGDTGPVLAIAPDHRWALTPLPPRLWDLRAGKLAHALDPSQGWWGTVAAFSPDSRRALCVWATNVANERRTQLAVWAAPLAKAPKLLEGPGGRAAAFTSSGKQVVGLAHNEASSLSEPFHAEDGLKVNIWDAATRKVVRSVKLDGAKEAVHKVIFSSDARLVLVATGAVRDEAFPGVPPSELQLAVWDLMTGRLVNHWTRPPAGPSGATGRFSSKRGQ